MPRFPRHALVVSLLLALPWVLAAGACSSEAPVRETAIDRETFISTWIDLREAALRSPRGDLAAPQRERILAEHGVTPEEMEEFARIRGADADYMRGVWEEVEERMRTNAGEITPDSISTDGAG